MNLKPVTILAYEPTMYALTRELIKQIVSATETVIDDDLWDEVVALEGLSELTFFSPEDRKYDTSTMVIACLQESLRLLQKLVPPFCRVNAGYDTCEEMFHVGITVDRSRIDAMEKQGILTFDCNNESANWFVKRIDNELSEKLYKRAEDGSWELVWDVLK